LETRVYSNAAAEEEATQAAATHDVSPNSEKLTLLYLGLREVVWVDFGPKPR